MLNNIRVHNHSTGIKT